MTAFQDEIERLAREGDMTGAETAALRLLATGFDQLNAALTAHLRDCPHVAPPISRGDLLLVNAQVQRLETERSKGEPQ